MPAPTLAPAATPFPPTATPVPPLQLITLSPGSLVHPLPATIISNTLYTIDSGRLKAIDIQATSTPRVVAPPGGDIEGYPIQELAALSYSPAARTMYLLDRSGAVYGWDLPPRWWLERKPGGDSDYSQEYPVDLASDGQTTYLLDTNNGRIWQRANSDWTRLITNAALEGGIRLAALGNDLYILIGERPPQKPARLLRLRGSTLSDVKVSGGLEEPSLLSPAPGGGLFLVDRGFRRVRLLDPPAASPGISSLLLPPTSWRWPAAMRWLSCWGQTGWRPCALSHPLP